MALPQITVPSGRRFRNFADDCTLPFAAHAKLYEFDAFVGFAPKIAAASNAAGDMPLFLACQPIYSVPSSTMVAVRMEIAKEFCA
jgi:hypothetical protein